MCENLEREIMKLPIMYSKISTPFTFLNQATKTDRQTDGCRSQTQRVRERAEMLTRCHLKMAASASQPHVSLSVLPRELYYL